MTRINLVAPTELYDQHLVAEYREIFMVGSSLLRSLRSSKWNEASIPKKFTLGKGHVTFFYNKGKYLHIRYLALVREMKLRGMQPDPTRTFKKEQFPDHLYLNWYPSKTDKDIVRERIALRINQRPDWYRKTKHI